MTYIEINIFLVFQSDFGDLEGGGVGSLKKSFIYSRQGIGLTERSFMSTF